jgi:hypothetical protein
MRESTYQGAGMVAASASGACASYEARISWSVFREIIVA